MDIERRKERLKREHRKEKWGEGCCNMLLSVTIFLLDFMSLFHMIEFVREYRMNKDEEGNEENRERERRWSRGIEGVG